MSAFGDKVDLKRYCEESPLMTQSGHAARARSPFDKEACVGCTERSTASLGGNKRLAALALIHSVHNHTDDDGNDSTTHTTADQLTSERSGA
jgi:hypothetical protein